MRRVAAGTPRGADPDLRGLMRFLPDRKHKTSNSEYAAKGTIVDCVWFVFVFVFSLLLIGVEKQATPRDRVCFLRDYNK